MAGVERGVQFETGAARERHAAHYLAVAEAAETAMSGPGGLAWRARLAREHDSTAAWWLQRPLIIGVSGAFLVGLIALFGRFERPRARPR